MHTHTHAHTQVRESTPSGTRDVVYEVLNILGFSSARKRMSVIVRDDQGRLLIFTKASEHAAPRHAAVQLPCCLVSVLELHGCMVSP